MSPMIADSIRISRRMRQRDAPMARLIPISRVRSATDMAIVLMTERPPMTRLRRPMPIRIALSIEVAAPICWSKSLPVIVVMPAILASISSATVSGLTPGSGYTVSPVAISYVLSLSATSAGSVLTYNS